jgi:hypothetical protein
MSISVAVATAFLAGFGAFGTRVTKCVLAPDPVAAGLYVAALGVLVLLLALVGSEVWATAEDDRWKLLGWIICGTSLAALPALFLVLLGLLGWAAGRETNGLSNGPIPIVREVVVYLATWMTPMAAVLATAGLLSRRVAHSRLRTALGAAAAGGAVAVLALVTLVGVHHLAC